MSVTLTWSGLQEFKTALHQLPDELKDEGAVIVERAANDAAREIEAGYPIGPTGNLKRGVTVTRDPSQSRLGVRVTVRSRAKHAHLFERGTKGLRRTHSGANRGRMPEAAQSAKMIPKAQRVRRRMVTDLIALVRRAGFQVTG